MSPLPPVPLPRMDPKSLADRLARLLAEAPSVRYEDLPKGWRGYPSELSDAWASWSSRTSSLLRAHYAEPSPVYWAIADADRRVDDIFAEPQSSFERVKDLYLEAIRLALDDLGSKGRDEAVGSVES